MCVYVFSPAQKSPIPPASNRFDEANAASLQRPKKKLQHHMRGKAKALYNFTAQNPR